MVNLAVRPLRVERDRRREATVGFETTPGHQAHVLGRACTSWDDLNAPVQVWIRTVADQRVHSTTFRKPAEALG